MRTRSAASLEERVVGAVDGLVQAAADAARAGRQYLATEEGRELRRRVAGALIVAVPVVGEFPLIRRTPVGRVLRIAGITALVVKGAEWLRDWEPAEPPVPSRSLLHGVDH